MVSNRKLFLSSPRRSLKNRMRKLRPCDVETLHLDHSYSKTITDKIEEGNDVRNPSVHKNEICSKSDSPTIKQTCLGKPDDDHITKDAASPSVMERERPNPPSGTSSSFAATNETSSSFTFSGRRLIDMKYFLGQIINSGYHAPFDCSFLNMEVIREDRRGLECSFIFRCRMCNITQEIHTEDPNSSDVDINTGIVLGATSVGIGYSQCNELLSTINVPFMAANTFVTKERQLAAVVNDTTMKVMEQAGEEEAQLAREAGDVDSEGIPCITVIADGAWSKRSYNVNYNASSGVACIIGQRTRKLLYVGIRNKYCCVCAKVGKMGKSIPQHQCFKNWTSSSTAMESDIIVEGFKISLAMHGLKYTKLVGDGDSSVHKKLLLAKPYGNVLVEKIECRNHLYRNFCSKLRELSSKTRSSSTNAAVPLSLRRVVLCNIEKLSTLIKTATTHRISEDRQFVDKIACLQADILNSPLHTFGEHDKCPSLSYIVCTPKDNEMNYVPAMKACGLYEDVVACLYRLINNCSSLLMNMNNNDAEHYNAAVCKFVGGKRINFSQRGSYEYRCKAAAISFNQKEQYHGTMHRALTNTPPQSFKRRYIQRKVRERMARMQRQRCLIRRRKKIVQHGPDAEYGQVTSLVDAPDVPDEIFKAKEKAFLKTLQKTPEDILAIEAQTRGQSANPKWMEERLSRLTASNFGSICKMRFRTSKAKKVEHLLYNNFFGNTATKYGVEHEALAIKQLEKEYDLVVVPCGLFIHSSQPYLGASPDGLIGDEGIVEIKCPLKCKSCHPRDAIKEGIISFANINNNDDMNLKVNDNYYYQVQGQLEVTNREYCYFVVWSPKGILVEKISRDNNFWRTNMEQQLKMFYMNCMLPEIIDPRKKRNLPIRSPPRHE